MDVPIVNNVELLSNYLNSSLVLRQCFADTSLLLRYYRSKSDVREM